MYLILLAIFLSVMACIVAYHLAIYALPFIVLCGRPHKTIYVASADMWRTGGLTPFTRTTCA
ncbi:hypothetical protein KCX83_21055 [Brucella oryzae]|uniref:hypothetical protein n=1 Tax=Brucella oryzae TaxID=335286 RepID=UPI001B836581|nr:hypothetical protein [Brucella oryzae]MBR7654788.1 hypothetical protein [Brucella oryzae]